MNQIRDTNYTNWHEFHKPNSGRLDKFVGISEIRVYTAAASFGSSMVPLNFGGSSSTPKLSE